MKSYPYDSHITGTGSDSLPVYDRAANAEQLALWMRSYFTDGIFPDDSNGFLVSAAGGMNVSLKAGRANVQGHFAVEDNARQLSLQAADGQYSRYDLIVIRSDTRDAVRACDLYVVTGTAAASPAYPSLTRTATVYELALAAVYVPAGITYVSGERITDLRYNGNYCGVVAQAVSQIDTTFIFQQVQAYLDTSQSTFEAWFETVQGLLDGDVAGNLASELAAVKVTANNALPKASLLNALTATTTGKALDAYQGKLLNDKINNAALTLANNLTTTTTGKALDAYQGKLLNDRIQATAFAWIPITVINSAATVNGCKSGKVCVLNVSFSGVTAFAHVATINSYLPIATFTTAMPSDGVIDTGLASIRVDAAGKVYVACPHGYNYCGQIVYITA